MAKDEGNGGSSGQNLARFRPDLSGEMSLQWLPADDNGRSRVVARTQGAFCSREVLSPLHLLWQQERTTGDARKSSRANKAPESRGRPSPFLFWSRHAVSGGPGGGGGGGLRAAGLRTTFLALTFLAGAFLMIFFAAVFLTDPFLAAAFFIGLFLAIALRAVFLTAPFFAVAFFATLFFAAAFLAGFLVVAFTMFKVPLLFLADWFKTPTRGLHSVPLLISRARGVAPQATQMSANNAPPSRPKMLSAAFTSMKQTLFDLPQSPRAIARPRAKHGRQQDAIKRV
jgi:hypothetical protein